MTPLTFAALCLATWRLSSLLADEDGPWRVLEKMRRAAGVRLDAFNQRYGENTLARGLLCRWCNSVWCGALFTSIMILVGELPWYWIAPMPLALSAGAILADEAIQALGRNESYDTTIKLSGG
jgi:hypothetical protein